MHITTKTLLACTAALAFAGSASAIDSVQNGDINNPATWGGTLPTAGDTGTWTVLHDVNRDTDNSPSGSNDDITDQTFLGQTLVIGNGLPDPNANNGTLRLESASQTLTVNDLVLNYNGRIFQDRDNNTLIGDTLTFNGDGGLISADRGGNMTINFENYAGDGTVYFFGNNSNDDNAVIFQTTNANPGTAFQSFTGTLWRDRLNGPGGGFGFGFNINVATFDIVLADTDADLPPFTNNGGARGEIGDLQEDANGTLFLTDDIDIKVTGLRLIDDLADGTNFIDVQLDPGVYALDTAANPGAIDLANVGGNDYSRFFTGGTGTVEIVGGTPALPGDTDGDGDVDDADLGVAFSNYTGPLAPNTGGKTAADGDADGDGDVDDADLGAAFAAYTGPLASAAVPEPTSLALLGLGGLAMIRRRRA
jgi:hypothetical protein